MAYTAELALFLLLIIPLVAAALIPLASKNQNLREGITLVAGVVLLANVIGLISMVSGGARPELHWVHLPVILPLSSSLSLWGQPLLRLPARSGLSTRSFRLAICAAIKRKTKHGFMPVSRLRFLARWESRPPPTLLRFSSSTKL